MTEEQNARFNQYGGFAFSGKQYEAIDALAVAMGCKHHNVAAELLEKCSEYVDRYLVDAAKRERLRVLDEMSDTEYYSTK